jgi:hypothetical protein
MLNWMALMGAMETLNRRPVVRDYAETHIFCRISASSAIRHKPGGRRHEGRPRGRCPVVAGSLAKRGARL